MKLVPVMFHHFYGGKHPKIQGALSAEQFEDLFNSKVLQHF